MSSLDACPTYDPEDDWQLTQTKHSYQASKAQVDYMALELALCAENSHGDAEISHLLVTPGIASTNIAADLLGSFLLPVMLAFFYIMRWLGSPHVSFSLYKAAVATVHIALADIASVPRVANQRDSPTMLKFTTLSTRLGHEYVGAWAVGPWKEHPNEGARVLDRCERLYQSFLEQEEEAEVEMTAEGS